MGLDSSYAFWHANLDKVFNFLYTVWMLFNWMPFGISSACKMPKSDYSNGGNDKLLKCNGGWFNLEQGN